MVIFNHIPDLKTGQVKSRISWRGTHFATTSHYINVTSIFVNIYLCDIVSARIDQTRFTECKEQKSATLTWLIWGIATSDLVMIKREKN